MSWGSISDYRGKGIEVAGSGSEKYVRIYTASALTEGTVYMLTFTYSASIGLYAGVVAPAAIATDTQVICVVQNAFAGVLGIAAAAWGWVQISGVCEYCKTSGTVAANDVLEVDVNISTTALVAAQTGVEVGGLKLLATDVGVAISNVTTNVWKVFLYGKQSAVHSSA